MIEKILSELRNTDNQLTYGGIPFKNPVIEVKDAISIVQEVAKEYGKDTNVRSNGWIPTAEMLFPRYGQKVLASVKCEDCKHEIIITQYKNQDYWHDGKITAWQPLPPVYQKGE